MKSYGGCVRQGACAVVLVFALSACGKAVVEIAGTPAPTATVNPATGGTPQTGLPVVTVRFGDKAVKAEVASTVIQRAIGLMHRASMPEDRGMLFTYAGRQHPEAGYWMKNTLIPLSIAYMTREPGDRYKVAVVLDMEPCRADPCQPYPPHQGYDATLEVNEGWFARNGVAVGAEATVEGALPSPR